MKRNSKQHSIDILVRPFCTQSLCLSFPLSSAKFQTYTEQHTHTHTTYIHKGNGVKKDKSFVRARGEEKFRSSAPEGKERDRARACAPASYMKYADYDARGVVVVGVWEG